MIEFINYKKKKYPVRISYRALQGFKKDTGKSFDEMGDDADLEYYESLLFHSLVSGAKANDLELELTQKDMEDVLDECFMEFIGLIPKFFPEGPKEATPNRRERRAGGKGKGKDK
jgi:hypothetical protein